MQIPRNPEVPCELCYCIRNHTACVMQECSLKVPGCEPVYQEGVCCPVKYMCGDGTVIGGTGLPTSGQVEVANEINFYRGFTGLAIRFETIFP